MHYIVGIDPGNKESAYCIVNESMLPVNFGKYENETMSNEMKSYMQYFTPSDEVEFAIENIASYGMPVGAEVFDTVRWIGHLEERLKGYPQTRIFRKDEKLCICNSPRANDATIRQALIDRFAPGEKNFGKGTKSNPGFFHGFKADIWAAFAVCVTCHDLKNERR